MSDAREKAMAEAERRWERESEFYSGKGNKEIFVAGAEWAKADLPDRETLADFIATERDKYPRRADDMDSEELADTILALFRGEEPK